MAALDAAMTVERNSPNDFMVSFASGNIWVIKFRDDYPQLSPRKREALSGASAIAGAGLLQTPDRPSAVRGDLIDAFGGDYKSVWPSGMTGRVSAMTPRRGGEAQG
jgi:hypothetical protein